MVVADMMAPDGRVFLKSEFATADSNWPCFSYSKRSLGDFLRREYRTGRDVVVYAGTGDPERTADPAHRKRLLSAVSVDPSSEYETKRIVPPEIWERVAPRFGGNPWQFSMLIVRAATMTRRPFPAAQDVAPGAYASLGQPRYRGNVVEVLGREREIIMDLPVTRAELNFTEAARHYLDTRAAVAAETPKLVKQAAYRMAERIAQRIARSGTVDPRTNPVRFGANISDTIVIITRKWMQEQGGLCALCGTALEATDHPLLQPSPDRIDSSIPSYAADNLQITHLACNLAKNAWSNNQFAEWLEHVRGTGTIQTEK
ncbi:hypothetical protein FE249_18670 (plasmid) [Acidiphilium multivorum]|uniref:hypothetical protein n=2 Tax=Acidiphilium TaxID=522 RepID=UPI001F4C3F94|nr:hypothetical protein [Acidiphilium multivorum]UNC16241.1 hypothetical protein FE249_18670 [Acidiphilium multivorum]